MDWRMYGNASAKTALEMAFFDLAGKAAQKPVAELLGGIRRTRMPILYMLATGDIETDVADAKAKKDAGEIGRAHVSPVTNAHLVCRLLLEKKKENRTEDEKNID